MKVTLSQHIQNFYIDEVNRLLNGKDKHLIIGANTICSGIELLGKICDFTSDLKSSGKSRKHFESAIKNFPSLNKYDSVKDSDGKNALYTDVRCSFSHGLMNGQYINLTESVKNGITVNNGKCIIGIMELYADFVIACNSLLSSNDKNTQNRLLTHLYDVFQVKV